jgi:hypothetical protein
MLNVFPASYESFVQSTISQKNQPTFDKLVGKLLHEEQCKETKFGMNMNEAILMQLCHTIEKRSFVP